MVILVAAAITFWQAAPVGASRAPMQMQGVVNDVRCGATRSLDCGRGGEPLDFVSGNGLVFTLADAAGAAKYAGQHIAATGTLDTTTFTITKIEGLKNPAPFCACSNPNDSSLTPEQEKRVEDAQENPEITPDGPGFVWEAADLAKLSAGATPNAGSVNGASSGFTGTWAGNLVARDGLSVVSVRVTLAGEKDGIYENVTDGCRGTFKYLDTLEGVAYYHLDIADGACAVANVRFELSGNGLRWGLTSAGTMPPASATVKLDRGGIDMANMIPFRIRHRQPQPADAGREDKAHEAALKSALLGNEHEGRPSQGRPTGKRTIGRDVRHSYSTLSQSRRARRTLDNKSGREGGPKE